MKAKPTTSTQLGARGQARPWTGTSCSTQDRGELESRDAAQCEAGAPLCCATVGLSGDEGFVDLLAARMAADGAGVSHRDKIAAAFSIIRPTEPLG